MTIRTSYLQDVANRRLERDGDPDQVEAEVLREALIAGLVEPDVKLTGEGLPQDGQPIKVESPATSLPDDTPGRVVEGVLREYTSRDERICFLFGRSMTPVVTARRLGRRPVLVDPYADCLSKGYRTTWEPDAVIEEDDVFDHLLFHLPGPGIVDRADFLYTDPLEPPPYSTHWESLSRNKFFDTFETRLRQWAQKVKANSTLAFLSTPSRFQEKTPGSETLMHPLLHQRASRVGWGFERRHPVTRPVNDLPVQDPALKRATLSIYTKQGRQS